LTDHLVKQFKQQIEELALLPSDGGRFEVRIDDELVYSKLKSGAFPDNRSIEQAVRERL
jgi:selenoprotein W-related protein